jgi:hypothetical protein
MTTRAREVYLLIVENGVLVPGAITAVGSVADMSKPEDKTFLVVETDVDRRRGILSDHALSLDLFIARLALNENLMDSAKLGIFLASVFSALAGLALLRWWPARGQLPLVDRG